MVSGKLSHINIFSAVSQHISLQLGFLVYSIYFDHANSAVWKSKSDPISYIELGLLSPVLLQVIIKGKYIGFTIESFSSLSVLCNSQRTWNWIPHQQHGTLLTSKSTSKSTKLYVRKGVYLHVCVLLLV